MQNPFGVSFFQGILDAIVFSAGSIFSAETMSIVLPFMIKMGMIATVVFGLISLFFTFFAFIKDKSMGYVNDTIDGFVGSKLSNSERKRVESRQEKINKVVDEM